MVGCSAAIAAMAGSRITQLAFAGPTGPLAGTDTLVVVFLRGGMDGINAVPPLGGADRGFYETARPDLKVPVSGSQSGNILALNNATLSGTTFGFHPGLAAFRDLYNAGALAVVHAAGLVNDTRSHFDAMQFMETGTPGVKTTGTGWLTRHLSLSGLTGTLPALSAGSTPAMSLMGRQDLITMSGPNGFDIGWQYSGDRKLVIRRMYEGQNWLHMAGSETMKAFDLIDAALGEYTPAPGANYLQYNGFSDQLKTIAQIIKSNPPLGLRAATIDLGGWDTHENQQNGNANAQGYFFNQLDTLSRSIAAFYTDLQASGKHTSTTLVVMSEFGRRFRENNNRGTDHGHGNAMFVVGGNVNGGRFYGNWPGLSTSQLYDGADLAIGTDYRTVLSEILEKRASNNNFAGVFPNYVHPGSLGIVR